MSHEQLRGLQAQAGLLFPCSCRQHACEIETGQLISGRLSSPRELLPMANSPCSPIASSTEALDRGAAEEGTNARAVALASLTCWDRSSMLKSMVAGRLGGLQRAPAGAKSGMGARLVSAEGHLLRRLDLGPQAGSWLLQVMLSLVPARRGLHGTREGAGRGSGAAVAGRPL